MQFDYDTLAVERAFCSANNYVLALVVLKTSFKMRRNDGKCRRGELQNELAAMFLSLVDVKRGNCAVSEMAWSI